MVIASVFYGDNIEEIDIIDVNTGKRHEPLKHAAIFPANLYVAPKERLRFIIRDIEDELFRQEEYFLRERKYIEGKRIKERTTFDLEMIRELGYCNGVKREA